MDFLSFLKKEYIPLNRIEISSTSLQHNYNYLAKSSGLSIAPALKSNAYGHGLIETAKILDPLGAPFFCVDSIYEAYELLKNNIKTPILIMGYIHPDNLKVKKLPFSFAVSTPAMLEAITTYQPHAGIHIFVDTGIRREGIPMDDLDAFIAHVQAKKGINIEGLMAHFAASDRFDDQTKMQVQNFQKAQKMLADSGIHPKWIHHANSSAVLNYKNYKGKIGNMARTGIALYGADPENKNNDLKPVLQFSSTLTQIKDLTKGESTGYDFTFTAKKNMKIGVIAAGYNDGVDRRLSNVGFVKVRNTFCKILGRVSMNLTVIDLTDVTNPQVGDEAIIFSNDPSAKNSVAAAAKSIDTIAYVLLVQLHASTKRIVR
jgi:alanine racemase